MRCDNCFHKEICIHCINMQNGTYEYMRYNFNPDECDCYSPLVVTKDELERLSNIISYHNISMTYVLGLVHDVVPIYDYFSSSIAYKKIKEEIKTIKAKNNIQ